MHTFDEVLDAAQCLPADERFRLMDALWDSLPDSTRSILIPQWHEQELEQRLAAADAAPEAAIPWEEVRDRLRENS